MCNDYLQYLIGFIITSPQVCLFDITSDNLSFTRGLDRQGGRVLSIAWHPDGDSIAVGGADSTIRKLDTKSGRCILRITLDEHQAQSTLVWDLKFLSDSTIVSADSLGKVQLWNSSHGTLVHAYKLHSADVLALAVNEEENKIYSAGIDQKVICLQKVEDKRSQWLKSNQVRAHSHDVRTLALSKSGLIASGGVDTQLVTCPVNSFEINSCIKHHHCPDSSTFFSVATGSNVLVHQSSMSLKFWQLSVRHRLKSKASSTAAASTQVPNGSRESYAESSSSEGLASTSNINVPLGNDTIADSPSASLPHCTNGVPKNFLEIKCKGPLHILSSALSPDAVNVALSTVENLWLYRIDHKKLGIQCTKQARLPAFKMAFSPDGQFLVLATIDEGVKCVNASTFDLDVARTVRDHSRGKTRHTVVDFDISPDSKLIAMSTCNKRICVCSLRSGDVLAKVPRLDAHPTLFRFHPSCGELVLFTGAEKQLYTFSILDKHLNNVGCFRLDRKYDGRTKLSCPNGLVALKEDVFAVYDNDCIALVRSKPANPTKTGKQTDKKRKQRSFEGEPLRYQFIPSQPLVLYVSTFGDGELVVAERSWTKILNKLPPALVRDQYGT